MPLDPTLSDVCITQSIRKYFVDNLYTDEGIFIAFETLWKTPVDPGTQQPLTQWIVFLGNIGGFNNYVGVARITAYLFTRQDDDGTMLSALRDKLFEYLVDMTATDGIRRVPLYDLAWNKVGGMMIGTGVESSPERGPDNTLYRFINLYFRFGAK